MAIIWLASYPKSGNTWMRLLLSNLLSDGDAPVDINNIRLDGFQPVKQGLANEASLVDTELLTDTERDQFRPLLVKTMLEDAGTATCDQFVKVHDAYRHLPDGTPLLGRGVARAALYILRDPRDVAVSLAHYYGVDLDKAIEFMGKDNFLRSKRQRPNSQIPQRLLDWSGHVRSWTGQQDVTTHVLRYEDMLTDTTAAFERVVAFLGLPTSPTALEKAVRGADFKELQRQEAEKGFRELIAQSISPFFRQGKAGGWTDVLTPTQTAAIEAAHGEVMAAYGYV